MAAIVGATLLIAATSAIGPGATNASANTADGCTARVYYPDYANGRVIFKQTVTCVARHYSFNMHLLSGWSNSFGSNDVGMYNTAKKCWDAYSCTMTSSVAYKGYYYYTSVAQDYITLRWPSTGQTYLYGKETTHM
jgi:hypothetical protein